MDGAACIDHENAAALQSEEWEALEAIYGNDIITLKRNDTKSVSFTYDVKFSPSCAFTIHLPESYPNINNDQHLPVIKFRNTCWSDAQKRKILNELVR